MSFQSNMGKYGFRSALLGSAAYLAIAAPISAADPYSQDAHTGADRIGFYFTRTPGAEAVITNVMGTDLLSVAVNGVTTPLQFRGESILAAENTFIYWDGTTFALGAANMASPSALAPFCKTLSTLAGGIDNGLAMYMTSNPDGELLSGVIAIAAPAAFSDPSTEYTDMYFLTKNNAGAMVEQMRLKAYGGIYGRDGTAFLPTWVFASSPGTGAWLNGAGYGISAGTVHALTVYGTNVAFQPGVDLTLDGGVFGGFLADVLVENTTARLLSAADYGRVIYFTNAGAIAVTFPDTLPAGFTCTLIQFGTGVITVSATGGGVVNNRSTQFNTAGQYALTYFSTTSRASAERSTGLAGGSAASAVFGGDTA